LHHPQDEAARMANLSDASVGPPPDDDHADPSFELSFDPHDFAPNDDPDYDPMDHMSASELEELEAEARYQQEQYEADLIRDALRSIQTDAVKAYLGSNGDAIDGRIGALLSEAKQLLESSHPGPALVLAGTALEITTRFLLLRPLVQGAFLSDRWAAILAEDFAKGRGADDRKVLPAILQEWGIDVAKVKTPAGLPVWAFITDHLWDLRNRFVHQADAVDAQMAAQAIACAETFRKEVVSYVAKRLGFTLDATGRWSLIQKTMGGQLVNLAEYTTLDPFAKPTAKQKTAKP